GSVDLGDGGEAELELFSGEGLALLVVAGLDYGFDEVLDGDGARSIECLVGDDCVAAVVQDGLDAADLIGGLADNVGFKRGGLVVPFGNSVRELDHVVVVAELELGLEFILGLNLAVGDVHLVLSDIQLDGDNLSLGVGDDGGNSGVDLRVAGLGAVGVQADTHT
ncbi:MAG: hypothetical protein II441_05950, partial [Oscillospiraceae bacterium]|nr:hypothetical protein [Oscillospiraceae bacterium]